ncbi:MAG: zincin-like metallopeptidase domain-containing protein [Erysipelotrichaceae bacterium]
MIKLSNAQVKFADEIVASLEKNQIPWRATWDTNIVKPFNAISNKAYSGMNQLSLLMESIKKGYDDPRWMTFKQANNAGYRIIKGSKGHSVFSFTFVNYETKETLSLSEYKKLDTPDKQKYHATSKTYTVFNGQQIDGIPKLEAKKFIVKFENEKAEAFTDTLLKNIKLTVAETGDRAFYNVAKDVVVVPDRNSQMDEESYYATLLHEVSHATSHPTRLNRPVDTTFGSDKYATEELRAEITSAFLSIDLGFHFNDFQQSNHIAYVQDWAKSIKDNKNIIIEAISDAEKIRNYMLENGNYNLHYSNDDEKEVSHQLIPFRIEQVISPKGYLNETLIDKMQSYDVPFALEYGYLNKNNEFMNPDEFKEKEQSTKTFTEFYDYCNDEGLCRAGHYPPGDIKDYIIEDYTRIFIDPKFLEYDLMPNFVSTVDYLTNTSYKFFNKSECLANEEILVNAKPLTREKLIDISAALLTEDKIQQSVRSGIWSEIRNDKDQKINDPENYIKSMTNLLSKDYIVGQVKDGDLIVYNINDYDKVLETLNYVDTVPVAKFQTIEEATDYLQSHPNDKGRYYKKRDDEVDLTIIKNSISIVDYARTVLGLNIITESKGLCRIEEHDSCKIYPNNTYYRFSDCTGGSIIDFIKNFEQVSIKEAIEKMEDYYYKYRPEVITFEELAHKKTQGIVMPEKAETNANVIEYLTVKRGIKPSVVVDCIKNHMLYEDVKENCVFVGKDMNNQIKYASVRGTRGNFKHDVAGSRKDVAIFVNNDSNTLVVNEATIDMLSYMSLVDTPEDFNYLSVNGAANIIPALKYQLEHRRDVHVNKMILAMDNDTAGEENTMKAIDYLKDNYPELEVQVHVPNGKDFNDDLKVELEQMEEMAREEEEMYEASCYFNDDNDMVMR